jgi:hypothetical protein
VSGPATLSLSLSLALSRSLALSLSLYLYIFSCVLMFGFVFVKEYFGREPIQEPGCGEPGWRRPVLNPSFFGAVCVKEAARALFWCVLRPIARTTLAVTFDHCFLGGR